jgi:hypothetical protein
MKVSPGNLLLSRRQMLQMTSSAMAATCAAKLPGAHAQEVPDASQLRGEWTRLRADRLKRFGFDYQRYEIRKPHEPGLLIANAEFGGMTNTLGLGVPTMWGAAIWANRAERAPMGGITLSCDQFGFDRIPRVYRQQLSLEDAVLRTTVGYEDGSGFETQQFFSMSSPGLFVLYLKNMGGVEQRRWGITLPTLNNQVETWLVSPLDAENNVISGASPATFTQLAWAVRANKALHKISGEEQGATFAGRYELALAPEESVLIILSTVAGGNDVLPGLSADECLQLARQEVMAAPMDFPRLASANSAAWEELWAQTAVLTVPDVTYERVWYRSLFQTIMTVGSKRYLPGESMFAVPCWSMQPFTYGAAGWGTLALLTAGLPQRAKPMLDLLYRPESLAENAAYLMRRLNVENGSGAALSFAHMQILNGKNFPCGHFEMQLHFDGFAAALFYRFGRYYPDKEYFKTTIYPVLRGTAEFWASIAQKDKNGGYVLPIMTGLSEDMQRADWFESAISAKYCLMLAHDQAVQMNADGELRARWKEVGDGLVIPQSAMRYLEFPGDNEDRQGGGYQGIRGFVYAGYPTEELAATLDPDKVKNTLDETWRRNRAGEGMIGFMAAWFGLCETVFGRGDHALTMLGYCLKCLDKWGYSISEFPENKNYYFIDNFAGYALMIMSMALQSYGDRIIPFPAVPNAWKNFAFYNLPAEAGIRVSGEMKDGHVRWVSYCKGDRELLRKNDGSPVTIRQDTAGKSVLQ